MQRTIRVVWMAVLGGVMAAADGCDSGNARQANQINVLCGGSFRPPMEELVSLFEKETGCRATLVFGQSEDHLPKVKEHTIGDVFVSHDPFVEYTEEAGAMLRYVPVGYVAPVLVVKKGNPKKLTCFDDLAREGLRVVLPNPEFSTCGEMVFALLDKKEKQQEGFKDAVLENVGNAMVKTHATTATQIQLGHRDAGIMWNGVAHNWLDALEIIPGPYEYDEEVRVAVMGLSYSKKRETVEKFLAFAEKQGREVFTEFGYVK